MSLDQKTSLDAPVKEQEVREAINVMKPGKSPGLDGFPVEYYKNYIDILAPVLTQIYSESFLVGQLPPIVNQAVISIILKKGKDPLNPASYRPISLAGVDYKILIKVLAMRLENILPNIIHSDQVGFVKGKASSDNLRRLLHLIWYGRKQHTPIAAFSLDAEKAFNRVEWGFLMHTLESFGFGDEFIKWITVIYADPQAAIFTNGLISDFFKLSRGTKQGDPLSPLLFVRFLEPLAATIRADQRIRGVQVGGKEHKLFLYADDILRLATDPEPSAPIFLNICEAFSEVSGYKINWQKSEVMPVSSSCHRNTIMSLQFKWIDVGMIYLGIKLCPDITNIIILNMSPILMKIKTNLDRWKLLNFSLWG
ncbi:hypothetical protein LDENG_00242520 [Lucifuga dentata]|nr:hypothetical protein LDENG_00242520 [Lucifuga dentata]